MPAFEALAVARARAFGALTEARTRLSLSLSSKPHTQVTLTHAGRARFTAGDPASGRACYIPLLVLKYLTLGTRISNEQRAAGAGVTLQGRRPGYRPSGWSTRALPQALHSTTAPGTQFTCFTIVFTRFTIVSTNTDRIPTVLQPRNKLPA